MKILIIIGISVLIVAFILFLIGYLSGSKGRLKKKFFTAVRSNDVARVKQILKKNDINLQKYKDTDSNLPLSIVAANGHIEMAELLIDHHADVNSSGVWHDFTPLIFAVTEGQTEMVKFLIDRGADVNAAANNNRDGSCTEGITPLMRAVERGDRELVELLIDKGADVNAKSAWDITTGRRANLQQATSFAFMAKMNVEQTVDYLFEKATKEYPAESFFKPPLLLAISNGHSEIAEILLKRDANPNWTFVSKGDGDWAWPLVPGMTALMYAAYRGDMKTMELLLAKKPDMNATDNSKQTALMYASHRGETGAIRLLVSKKADVNARDRDNRSAMWYAIYAGSSEAVKVLVESGADMEKEKGGQTALMWAAQTGQNNIINTLIELGSDVNEKTASGVTALMYAAGWKNPESVKLLIQKGANVNEKAKDKSTALINAVKAPSLEIMSFLLEQGANLDEGININFQDENGLTLLLLVSGKGQTESVKKLIEKGADVNFRNKEGVTALMEASWFGHTEMVKLLIDKGADVNAKNMYGEGAMDWTSMEGKFVADQEKVRQHVANFKSGQDQERLTKELINKRGVSAELYMEGKSDIYAENNEERKAAYAEIVKMLKEAGAV